MNMNTALNSTIPLLDRRRFLTSVSVAASGALLVAHGNADAATPTAHHQQTWLMFDPGHEDAIKLAHAAAETHARVVLKQIEGDRIRFGRQVFSHAPPTLVGVTCYSDFILLSECAAESGYRLIAEQSHAATQTDWMDSRSHLLVYWVMQRA